MYRGYFLWRASLVTLTKPSKWSSWNEEAQSTKWNMWLSHLVVSAARRPANLWAWGLGRATAYAETECAMSASFAASESGGKLVIALGKDSWLPSSFGWGESSWITKSCNSNLKSVLMETCAWLNHQIYKLQLCKVRIMKVPSWRCFTHTFLAKIEI